MVGCPSLGPSGIRIFDDATPRAAQLADVFDNFALSYIFVHLSRTSANRVAKSAIVQHVFASFSPTDLPKVLRVLSSNADDLALLQPSGLAFRVGT